MNKKWLVLGSVVLLIIGITIYTNKILEPEQIKTEELINKKVLAIKIEQEDGSYIDATTIPTSGYVFNQDKSKCSNGATPSYDDKTKRFYADNLTQNGTSCYLTFDIAPSKKMIDKLNVRNIKEGTPDFTQVATGAETEDNNGVYITDDPMYGTNSKTYYWRGAATTNHVIFDNKCWRIVRINGDGTIRLIYNGALQSGNTCKGNGVNSDSIVLNGTMYNEMVNNSKYVGWTYASGDNQRPSDANPQTSGIAAPIKVLLENWYSSNISSTSSTNVDTSGKFCNDRNTQNGETWRATGATQYYAVYQRNGTSSGASPTLSCPNGDIYELSVGMITADEVTYAGASGATNNTSYYLFNGQYYWTMSPNYWGSTNNYAHMFVVYDVGILLSGDLNITIVSVRPVINLRSDVTFNEGSDGTQNNPYIVQ